MDAFFASVEQKLRPDLKGKPVVVGELSSERGVVSAASYEARPSGIRAGMPLWEARQRCPHAVFLPGNIAAYAREALSALRIYQRYTPDVEPFSIDEAFLDVTGSLTRFGSAKHIAREIRASVREELELTVSIGVAPNRLLAKMVSDWGKPDGLTVLRPEDVQNALSPLPAAKLWGVGTNTGERLRRMGVRTVGDLRKLPLLLLKREFGVLGQTLHDAARGIDGRDVKPYYRADPAKSMGHEVTLERDTDSPAVLRLVLRSLSDKVARRMREEQVWAKTVSLKVKLADFKLLTRASTLPAHTDLEDVIFSEAERLLSRLDLAAKRLRLVGVGVTGFAYGHRGRQMSLFSEKTGRHRRLSEALDTVRGRFGEGAIQRASLLHFRERPLEDHRSGLLLDPEKIVA
jgi:DNA polymerase-4